VLLLNFYRDVGLILQKSHPGRRLGGFVYYNYQYPPKNPPTLPDNVYLCWAPLNYYGYGLLKLVYRDEFDGIMAGWSRIAPKLVYHNYSTWMRTLHGAPLPLSPEILNLELPTAVKYQAWGANMVGSSAWGVGAPVNYILARQMWDASLDVDRAFSEWLETAYGPGGSSMRAIYDQLADRMKRHKEAESPKYKGSMYEVNKILMEAFYVPMFPEMEERYLAAQKQAVTDAQRQRLSMFGDNLTLLHHALRQKGLLPKPESSTFYKDDAAFEKFLTEVPPLSLHRGRSGREIIPIWDVEYGRN
jgi:hypothetical protein